MFDLDKEVAAWSRAMHAERCRETAHAAELSDHLHCEIERGRAQGLSDEQAFKAAVAKLGAQPELEAEESKNRSLLGTVCAAAGRYERLRAGHTGLFLAHALLWAALMLATSAVLSKSSAPQAFAWLLTGVLVPTWWASEQLLRRALRPARPGRAE
jgi:hypothetical protein